MTRFRLALAQINPTVGDISGNAELIRATVSEHSDRGCDLIVFPEMVLTGYPVEDLALRASFQDASRTACHTLAKQIQDDGHGETPVIVGYLDYLDDADDKTTLGRPHRGPINCAAVIHRGEIVARYIKHHLPNYGVFDEYRYFVPGDESCTVTIGGVDVAIAICEDLWRPGGPVQWAAADHAGLLVVLNGSPYERNKDDVRLSLCLEQARDAGCALAYVNLVGGQDELVFDGDSLVVDSQSHLLARAPQFETDILVVDLELPAASGRHPIITAATSTDKPESAGSLEAPRLGDIEEIYRAVVVATRDYLHKNGARTALIGLSGGIDSALVAAIACDAIGADNVYGVSMPSVYSSQHSRDDARDLAERLGLHYRTVDIAPMVDAYLSTLGLTGLAEENLQARVRGTTLMGISNQEGQLVLATGNKSELAVGYSTMYGDAVGGYAPIKDVPKTIVWEMSLWRNSFAESRGEVPPIPPNSIEKPPSAELRPGQLDSDSLPDYAALDELLDLYVEQDLGAAELRARGLDHELIDRVLRLIDIAEYKRRQYPPGAKVTRRAFGRDRRQPITNRWREKG